MSEGGLFRSRFLTILIALAVASTIAFVALYALGPRVLSPMTHRPSSFSPSAIGYRGTFRFLGESGLDVARVQDRRLPRVDASTSLVITEPQPRDPWERKAEESDEEWPEALAALLADAAERGATAVVVLPKWMGRPHPQRSDWVVLLRRHALGDVWSVMHAVVDDVDDPVDVVQVGEDFDGLATSASKTSFHVKLRTPQVLPADDRFTPLLSIRHGLLAASFTREEGGPPIVVLADPDLLNNHGIDDADHAAAMLELFRDELHAKTVAFDETLHGFDDSGRLLRDAFSLPALLVTAHLALAIGIALWAGAKRFGPARPERAPRTLGREAFIDSTVRLLSGTRDEVSSLGAYWKLAQEVVAEELRLPPMPPPERLRRLADASAARRTGEDPRALDSEISTAVQFETDAKRWVDLAQRAHRWRMEMTGGLRSTP